MSDVRATARELHDAGLSVVRVKEDGSKQPDRAWKQYQAERSTPSEHDAWFGPDAQGIGVIFGAISGNSEMLELEGVAICDGYLDQITEIAEASGLGDVWKALLNGWVDESPKDGGLHIHFRVEGAPVKPNTKLASRPKRDDELTPEQVLQRIKNPGKVFPVNLVETRGEGGMAIVAPSHGRVHPTGKPYKRIAGGPATMPTLNAEEYAAIHALMRAIDEMPVKDAPASAPKDLRASPADGELRPGDDFETKVDWAEILEPEGWMFVYQLGKTRYWRRSGKNIGVSATTGHAPDRDRFYVFSTSTEFEPEQPYTKFGAYALLHHRSDFKAASRELRRRGYGSPLPIHAPKPATGSARQHTESAPIVHHYIAEEPMVEPSDADVPSQYEPAEPEPGIGEPVPFFDNKRTWDDVGNAERLIDRYAPIIRWVLLEKAGQWTVYDGKRWAFTGGDTLVRTLVRKMVESLSDGEVHQYDPAPILDPDTGKKKPSEQDKFKAFVHASRDNRTMGRCAAAASSFQQLHAQVYEFDTDRRYLNLPNGILDTDTLRLLQHDPTLMLSKMLATPYIRGAKAPLWDAFLKTNIPDGATRRYLQKAVGYSLSGLANEKRLFYLHGKAHTGKSLLLAVLMAAFGADYAIAAADGALRPRKFEDGANPNVDDMIGRRFVTTSESKRGERMDQALLKRLTGRDSVRTRALYVNNRQWVPECAIWVASNHYPQIDGDDDAALDRIDVTPFKVAFEEGHPDRDDKLQFKIIKSELPGVLAYAVEGLRLYHQEGLRRPPEVLQANAEFRTSSNAVARFINESIGDEDLVKDEKAWMDRAALHRMHKAWCEREDLKPLSSTKFYEQLEALGYTRVKRGVQGFAGIGPARRRGA